MSASATFTPAANIGFSELVHVLAIRATTARPIHGFDISGRPIFRSMSHLYHTSPPDSTSRRKVLALCERVNSDPRRRLSLHPAVGMHPEKADLAKLDEILGLIDRNAESIVCVGEVGLDYSRHLIGHKGDACERAKEVQREVFARQSRRAQVHPMPMPRIASQNTSTTTWNARRISNPWRALL